MVPPLASRSTLLSSRMTPPAAEGAAADPPVRDPLVLAGGADWRLTWEAVVAGRERLSVPELLILEVEGEGIGWKKVCLSYAIDCVVKKNCQTIGL